MTYLDKSIPQNLLACPVCRRCSAQSSLRFSFDCCQRRRFLSLDGFSRAELFQPGFACQNLSFLTLTIGVFPKRRQVGMHVELGCR
eukprot:s96_g8.t1